MLPIKAWQRYYSYYWIKIKNCINSGITLCSFLGTAVLPFHSYFITWGLANLLKLIELGESQLKWDAPGTSKLWDRVCPLLFIWMSSLLHLSLSEHIEFHIYLFIFIFLLLVYFFSRKLEANYRRKLQVPFLRQNKIV